jgi:hypothetical protein
LERAAGNEKILGGAPNFSGDRFGEAAGVTLKYVIIRDVLEILYACLVHAFLTGRKTGFG